MDESRNWCLLSNYIDRTLLKNKFMYDLAKRFDLPYAPSIEVIDLYINGEYLGVYNISEKVEVSDNMVNIHDLEAYNKKFNKGIDLEYVPQGGEYGEEIKMIV